MSRILMLLLDRCNVFREGSDQSRYIHVHLFLSTEKVGGNFLCCPPEAEQWGTCSFRPSPIDAHVV